MWKITFGIRTGEFSVYGLLKNLLWRLLLFRMYCFEIRNFIGWSNTRIVFDVQSVFIATNEQNLESQRYVLYDGVEKILLQGFGVKIINLRHYYTEILLTFLFENYRVPITFDSKSMNSSSTRSAESSIEVHGLIRSIYVRPQELIILIVYKVHNINSGCATDCRPFSNRR